MNLLIFNLEKNLEKNKKYHQFYEESFLLPSVIWDSIFSTNKVIYIFI